MIVSYSILLVRINTLFRILSVGLNKYTTCIQICSPIVTMKVNLKQKIQIDKQSTLGIYIWIGQVYKRVFKPLKNWFTASYNYGTE